MKLEQLQPNPDNPRTISDEDLLKMAESIKNFPKMMKIRPIVLDGDTVIGGNQRFQALKLLNYDEAPDEWFYQAEHLSDKEKREFIIKDNVSAGEWDFEMLLENWENEELNEWGVDAGGFDVNPDDFGEEFDLPQGEKTPFQQITFTLANEQSEFIKEVIKAVKQSEDYKSMETLGNENGNGNAIYLIVKQWEKMNS